MSGAQVRVGPRREHPADPQVELALGQPALNKRGFQYVDRLVAVGMRGPQLALLVRRPVCAPCRHGCLPYSTLLLIP